MPFNKTEHFVFCVKATGCLGRMQGLIGKLFPFPPLYIPRCDNIHTFFMKTPLSLLWLDDFFTVIRIDYHVLPWRIKFCVKAEHVVEFEKGKLPDGIKIGDTLTVRRYDV